MKRFLACLLLAVLVSPVEPVTAQSRPDLPGSRQPVRLTTPRIAPLPESQWTDEHHLLVPHLHELGIGLVVSHNLVRFDGTAVHLAFVHTREPKSLPCATLVLNTSRTPNRELYDALAADPQGLEAAGIVSLTRVGDCLAPGLTADAVYAGHRYAEELDAPEGAPGPLRERIVVGETRATRAAEATGW